MGILLLMTQNVILDSSYALTHILKHRGWYNSLLRELYPMEWILYPSVNCFEMHREKIDMYLYLKCIICPALLPVRFFVGCRGNFAGFKSQDRMRSLSKSGNITVCTINTRDLKFIWFLPALPFQKKIYIKQIFKSAYSSIQFSD